MSNAEQFVIFIRTQQFFQQRLKGVEVSYKAFVYVSSTVISERFFPYPKFNKNMELQKLVDAGEIEIDKTGKAHKYRALRQGAIDISLLKPNSDNYGYYTLKMRDYLQIVSLPAGVETTDYFALFLKHKANYIDVFFTVDDYAGRVHTPVSSLYKEHRPLLLLGGLETAALDVVQMQPTLLGNILEKQIGDNDFSSWINSGKDIYQMLQTRAGLPDRDSAKKYFFKIAFGVPDNELAENFGNANWVNWVNAYKSTYNPNNPKGKIHGNLAWLLQSTEVQVMRKVWRALIDSGIVFCTVHDEIIVPLKDLNKAKRIMTTELQTVFKYFRITVKGKFELKAQFKAEFLNEKELPVEAQPQLWQEYKKRGLLAIDAKEVCIDLLENHGFIAA